MPRHLLTLFALLSCTIIVFAQDAGPQIFPASAFVKADTAGALIDDPLAPGQQVFQLGDNKLDFGFSPKVQPGLYRLTLRMMTTTSATGTLSLYVSSGNWKKSPYYRDDPPIITGEALPEVRHWYDVSRLVHFTGDGYWGGVIGGWKGLCIDRFTVARVTEPAVILQVLPNKLLYALGEAGTVGVKLVNTTAQPQTIRLAVSVESGLADAKVGTTQTVTLPAISAEQRLARNDVTEVSVPLPALAEYGNTVTVKAFQGDKQIGEGTEYCYCSNRPLQVGQYFGWSFPGDYTCANASGHFETMRRSYFPIAECFFWAPCDCSAQTPERDTWWSGQTLCKLGKEPLRAMIAQGHQQGFSFISYATRWGFGQRMWEFGRKHPDQVEWEVPGFQLSYAVSHLEIEAREKDAEYNGLGSSGILTAAWGNPEAVASHVKTLQDSMRMFGWDGFRYDNGSPVIDEVEDVYGRQLPLPGWDHAQCIAALRNGPRQVKSGAIYGNNTGWNLDMDSKPSPGDPFTQQARDGGLLMQEGETNGGWGHKKFTEEANRYFRAGYNAIRFGGQQYNIINPYLTGSDHFYQVALTAAGACHICYHVRDEVHALMQMICRHCDLFYGDGLRFVRTPESVVQVTAPPQVLWRDYVRYRQLSPTHRVYLVHLINPPPGEKLGESKGAFPDPIAGISTRWTLPRGWKATHAYELTGDGGYRRTALSTTVEGDHLQVTLPRLRCWSILVLDASGPALPLEPTLTPLVANAAAVGSLTSSAGVALLQSPADAVNAALHYYPSEAREKPYSLKMAAYFAKRKNVTVVDDATATNGKALLLGEKGFSADDFGYAPGNQGVGHYRLTLRVKTTVPPPANGSISGFVSSGNNNATPGAKSVYANFRFHATAITTVNQWTELTGEGDMTYANYWGGFSGGWAGLQVDSFTLTKLRPLTRAEQLADLTAVWPETLALTPHQGVRVWYGAGLYYQYYHLKEALDALGAKTDFTTTWRYRGPAGFDQPFPKTPEELAAYDLIILAGAEARMLTPTQQQWLDAFVQHGGRALFLGGPYGFGCGGWAEANLLADLLPVTLHAHDLLFAGKDKPVSVTPTSALAKSVSWQATPTVRWLHAVEAKPTADIHAVAAGHPAIVTGSYGHGKVGVITLAPLGEDVPGATPFWNWSEWPKLMITLCRNLLEK